MGYFSRVAMELNAHRVDISWTPHRQQLLWRWEELCDRLKELEKEHSNYKRSFFYPEQELRYVLPEDFYTSEAVRQAMELTARDLKERYKIQVLPDPGQDTPTDELTGNQISLFATATAPIFQ